MLSLDGLFGEESTVLRDLDFQLLLFATTLPVLGTALVSPVLDSVIEPFGTTPASVGLMVSFTTAPAIVLIPIAGVLADRYGRRPILVWSLLLFGLAGSAIAATTDFRIVLGLRFLQGVGFAGLSPTITTAIGDMYTARREATGQGLRMATNGLSGATFPLLAGVLVTVAWQFPFLLYAIAIPIAGAVYRWFEEPTDHAAEASEDEADGGSYWQSLRAVLSRRYVIAIVAARSLPIVVWIAFLTYNSLVVIRLVGGTAVQAGVLVAVGNLVFAAAGSQVGRIAPLFGSRHYPLALGHAALGGGWIAVLFAPTIYVAFVGVVFAGIGLGVTITLYRSILTGLAAPALRGSVVSVGAAVARTTATATPVVMGAVIAAVEPSLGLAYALRVAGLGAAVVTGVGGVACLLVAHTAPPMTPT